MTKLLIEHDFIKELYNILQRATVKIYSTIYYARIHKTHKNDDTRKIIQALADAKNRGVEIKILINNPSQKNKLNTSIQYFIYQLQESKIDVKQTPQGRITHAKTWIIDNDKVIIGSHNLTLRSLRISREISILVIDEKINKQLTEYFLKYYHNTKN